MACWIRQELMEVGNQMRQNTWQIRMQNHFIEKLLEFICQIMSSCWVPEKIARVHILVCHATSLTKLQKIFPKTGASWEVIKTSNFVETNDTEAPMLNALCRIQCSMLDRLCRYFSLWSPYHHTDWTPRSTTSSTAVYVPIFCGIYICPIFLCLFGVQ